MKKILFTSTFGITGGADDFVEDGAVFAFPFPDTVVQFASLLGISIYMNKEIYVKSKNDDVIRTINE
jgi:hypothetical protein